MRRRHYLWLRSSLDPTPEGLEIFIEDDDWDSDGEDAKSSSKRDEYYIPSLPVPADSDVIEELAQIGDDVMKGKRKCVELKKED